MNGQHVYAVDELLDQIAAAVYDRQLGYLAVTGILTDWRRHRYGSGSGELVTGNGADARLRLHANPHAASAIDIGFGDAGYDPATPPASATAHGQVLLHRRRGLQLDTSTIELHQHHHATEPSPASALGNHNTGWPERIDTIGLIDPLDGDDARHDVLTVWDQLPLTVIEHRVPITGPQAVWRISRALDTPRRRPTRRPHPRRARRRCRHRPRRLQPPHRHRRDRTTPRPVITGIGHATNTTAADHAAYLSCITPTAAAQTIVDQPRKPGDDRRANAGDGGAPQP